MKKIVAVLFLVVGFICVNNSQLMAQEAVYRVEAGDCLSTIAREHSVSVDYLMQVNNLQSDFLHVGDELTVSLTSTSTTPSRSQESPAAAAYYTVKAGDNLYQIALSQGTTVQMLWRVNNLSSDMIYPGQRLLLPRQTTPSRSGTIVSSELLINKAAEYLGTPYRYGGQAPGGFDCSGFVSYIFNQFGHSLPHNAAAQANLGIAVEKDDLIIGDLVFFNGNTSYINHVGIYSGNDQFIHSSSPRSGGVIYSSLNENYYARTYVTARRILR